jgi:hypothetical protein
LKLRVRNTGYRTVNNCKAQIHILVPRRDVDPNDFPSSEYKQLAWGRLDNLTDINHTTSIHGHDFGLFHVVFSNSRFRGRHACISTIDDLRSDVHRTEETFTPGRYTAEILITTDEGPYVKAVFSIEVTDNWELLMMNRMSKLETIAWKLKHHYYS